MPERKVRKVLQPDIFGGETEVVKIKHKIIKKPRYIIDTRPTSFFENYGKNN